MYVRKDNLDRTTFIGAVSSIYYELHSLYPNALIMFITPSGLSYTGGNNIDSVKKTFQIKNAAYYVNCPVCEWVDVGFGYYGTLYTGDGTYENPYELSEEYTMAKDWLHPNEKFGDILANKVVGELNKYIPIY